MTHMNHFRGSRWTPYDQLAACRQSGVDAAKSLGTSHDRAAELFTFSATVSDSTAVVRVATADGERSMAISYVCFPGSFDPRPK